jgi:Transposase IS116/IS110/IS902 family
MHSVSDVVAAGLIGHAGDLRNYRNAGAFAAKCGAAPVPCSSGRHIAVRVNRGGDRQLNRLLHVIALAQVARTEHAGRQYYERKRAEGKTHPSAMRCLKRQLAGVVYYRLSSIQGRLALGEMAARNGANANAGSGSALTKTVPRPSSRSSPGEIRVHRCGEGRPLIAILCRCLRVTRSGFYAWQRRPESPHAVRERQLRVLIRTSYESSRRCYGSPRVHETCAPWASRLVGNASRG